MPSRPGLALILALAASIALGAAAAPRAEHTGTLIWTSESPDFGGFSGIDLSEDGETFVTVSDRGRIFEGRILRENGKITGLSGGPLRPLLGVEGEPVVRRTYDAEGLAINPDGGLFISFEGYHRVWQYARADGPARKFHPNRDFKTLQNNSGLEALAIDDNGTLYAVPERSGALDRPFPVYVHAGRHWTHRYDIPRRPPYLVVGADFGPDGRFYLLERHLAGILGFRTRVRRFDIGADGMTGEETILETSIARHDNLEGIGVWRDSDGFIRLTMISDDNQRSFQRTEIVEYRVIDGLDPPETKD